MGEYERTGTIVRSKFFRFLLPTLLSNAAVSLDEFVDSIVVSQLLGSDAMALVNMAYPVTLVFSTIYTMLGVGGSIVYTDYIGNQEKEAGKRVFSTVLFAAIALGIIICLAGLLFLKPFAEALCSDEGLRESFIPYLGVLLVSGVLIIPLQVIITFTPSLGSPEIGTKLNIVANVLNLAFDFIYIRFFETGLAGVALATLTGYITAILILTVLTLRRRIDLPLTRHFMKCLKQLPSISLRGSSPAVNQLGYCVKIAFCNTFAMALAGISGVTVFSLCIQVVSMVSVILGGVIEAMIPIVSSLRGQRDFNGITLVVKTVMKVVLVTNLAITILLELFPQIVLYLYDIESDLAEAAITGIRIFSIMFVFRGFVILFMYYLQVIDRNLYAIVISITDGFLGLIPLVLILGNIFGINGMWAAFPLLSAVMLIAIMIINTVIVNRSEGKYDGVLLIETEDSSVPIYDATIHMNEEEASGNARRLQEFCTEHGLDESISMVTAVAAEEMAVYSFQESRRFGIDQIDVLVKIYPDYVLMDFRSVGQPFNPLNALSEDFSNVDILKKLASSLDYEYASGINQTRIQIDISNDSNNQT